MKKCLLVFVSCMLCSLAALFALPQYIMQEADRVQLTEEILLGDSSMVEGVRINSHSHCGGTLFWDTEYTVGTRPQAVTEQYFDAGSRNTNTAPGAQVASWYNKGGYRSISLLNRLYGGWSVSSSGSIDVDSHWLEDERMLQAYEELAAEVAPGEEKSRQIFLSNYMDYFPVSVSLDVTWLEGKRYGLEALEEAYSEFFKVLVPEYTTYIITVAKNKKGEISKLEGMNSDQPIFSWNTVCAASDTDLYFTFYRHSADGTRVDTSLIPGGFGVYRQPYSVVDGELVIDTEQLSMVYSLEDELYPYGSMFLDVNDANQLVILTDKETTTSLQVVDMETWELVQRVELERPAESRGFGAVVRVTEEFIMLWYGSGYFSLVDWTAERGYEQQLLIAVEENDPLYRHGYVNENDMDWNGERLVYACYSTNGYSAMGTCNLELSVYDKTGKIYHGRYYNSLLTEQEYSFRPEATNNWYMSCEPRTNVSLKVEWTEQQ